MANRPPYDISTIKEILPHRSPFLFVDRIMELKASERIVAEKDLSPDESFFEGHFPGNPIMPGVLVSESLAQTSGILLGLIWKESGSYLDQKKPNLYLANLDIKFSTIARPGETLRLEATFEKKFGKLFLFKVAAHVVTRRIAKGTLMLAQENS